MPKVESRRFQLSSGQFLTTLRTVECLLGYCASKYNYMRGGVNGKRLILEGRLNDIYQTILLNKLKCGNQQSDLHLRPKQSAPSGRRSRLCCIMDREHCGPDARAQLTVAKDLNVYIAWRRGGRMGFCRIRTKNQAASGFASPARPISPAAGRSASSPSTDNAW